MHLSGPQRRSDLQERSKIKAVPNNCDLVLVGAGSHPQTLASKSAVNLEGRTRSQLGRNAAKKRKDKEEPA